jgi:hypothetical protein
MRKKFRGLFTSVALILVIMLSVGTAYAASTGVSIPVVYDNIKVLLNGNELKLADVTGKTVEPFIYDGTTYLPIRAIAESFNKTIEWDAEARQVLITDTNPISPVPDKMKEILKPDILDLLGKSRAEIRDKHRIETSEHDTAFWYSGLGILPDGTEGNVFISYNIDGMTYNGLCDYISGEIERISLFERGTTFEQFEKALEIKPVAEADGYDEVPYQIGDYAIFAQPLTDNTNVIYRLTIKDQPASTRNE